MQYYLDKRNLFKDLFLADCFKKKNRTINLFEI